MVEFSVRLLLNVVTGFELTQFKHRLHSSFLCLLSCSLVIIRYACCGGARPSLSSAEQAQPHCCKAPLSPGPDSTLALLHGVNGTPFTFRGELRVDLSRVSPFPRLHSPSPSAHNCWKPFILLGPRCLCPVLLHGDSPGLANSCPGLEDLIRFVWGRIPVSGKP